MHDTQAPIKKSAVISSCAKYRYELRREWDSKRPLVIGMLNPSIADDKIDDPTISRLINRAKDLGCGSLIVWNLGAGRSKNPAHWKSMQDPIGPENDKHIKRILKEALHKEGLCFVGWGNHGIFLNRHLAAQELAEASGVTLHCLGTTKRGQPRHPLFVPYSQKPIQWIPKK